MTTTSDPLVTAWLDRVRRLATALPPGLAAELLADLEDHLAEALPPGSSDDEVTAVLARLGEPAEIVDAANGEPWPRPTDGTSPQPPPPPPTAAPRTVTPTPPRPDREGLTLGLLVVSGLTIVVWPVAVAVWIAAVVLLATRTRWRGGETVVALLVPVGSALAVLAPIAGFVLTARTCVSVDGGPEVCDGASGFAALLPVVAFVLLLVGTVAAVVWLLRRVRDRPA